MTKTLESENSKFLKDVGTNLIKATRDGLIAFGGLYLIKEGLNIAYADLESLKHSFYISEVTGIFTWGVSGMARIGDQLLKISFPNYYKGFRIPKP